MASSGFEGFEKRLELHFSGDDPAAISTGLRQLHFDSLEQILRAVQCSVVSACSNEFFDAYVLSESSLFIYPTKIIIKTCGSTQLLKSIPPLLSHSQLLGLHVSSCRYTRGSFIFPQHQPSPHTSFQEEVLYLNQNLPPSLCYRKARVLPSCYNNNVNSSVVTTWHVYSASDSRRRRNYDVGRRRHAFTMEVCMTQLDRTHARKFFRRKNDGNSGEVAGREMTRASGIGEINPNQLICDFAFDPCGYSMNGIDGPYYSTIHVTPEDGYSYASFECVGSINNDDDDDDDDNDDDGGDLCEMLRKVVQVFKPGTMSVSMTGASQGVSTRLRIVVESFGLTRRSCSVDEFPEAGSVVFQTFTTRRK